MPTENLRIYLGSIASTIAQDIRFDNFIMISILLNTIIFSIKWNNLDRKIELATEILNYIFAAIVTIEAAIKLVAYDKRYFKDGWNVFDITIVIGNIIGIFLQYLTNLSVGPSTTVLRAFRIGRILKLFRRNKSLKIIFQTFIASLPAIANVGSLLMLFVYIYAILGVFLFAEVKISAPLNTHANF